MTFPATDRAAVRLDGLAIGVEPEFSGAEGGIEGHTVLQRARFSKLTIKPSNPLLPMPAR